MTDTKTEVAKLNNLVAGNTVLRTSGSSVTAYIDEYISQADTYHDNVIAKNAAEVKLGDAGDLIVGSSVASSELYERRRTFTANAKANAESSQVHYYHGHFLHRSGSGHQYRIAFFISNMLPLR
jgi:hypothetical protein